MAKSSRLKSIGSKSIAMLATVALMYFNTAFCAEARAQLEEIVVVAQKREQNLQDVPISISAWSGEKITSVSLADLQELATYVPNLVIQAAPITDVIAIRGIQSYLNPGFEQSVGLFSDGVYRGRGVQSRFAFLDVERVEVLRGPQDTLFGSNTIAGAVIMSSRQPTDQLDAAISMLREFEHDETVWKGHLSGPLADELSGRIAFIHRSLDDGWVHNPFYDERIPSIKEWAARGTLRWAPSDLTTLTFRYEHGEFDNGGNPSEIFVSAPPLGPDAPNGGVDGVANFVTNAGNTSPEIDAGTLYAFDGSTDEGVLEFRHTLRSGNSFTGILAHSSYSYDRLYDADANPYDAIGLADPEDFDQTTVELRYDVILSPSIDLLTGVYYLDGDLRTESFGRLNVVDPLTTVLFGDVDGDGNVEFVNVPDPAGAALTNAAAATGDPSAALLPFLNDFTRYTFLDQRTKSAAVFGEVSLKLSDRVTATLGLRYTNNDKDGIQGAVCLPFDSRSGNERDISCELLPDLPAILATAAQLDLSDPDPAVLAMLASLVNGRELALVAESVAHVTPLDRDEDFVSGHVGIQWNANADTMLFAMVRRGLKAGGFNAYALTPQSVEFDEEEVLSAELGAKLLLLNGKGELNATLFNMDYEDLQVSQFTGNTSFIVDNAASATVRGLEVESRWQVTDSFAIRGDFAINDFEFDSYRSAGCTVPQTIETGLTSAECAAAAVNDLSGRPPPRAPERTLSVSLQHRLRVGDYELESAFDWNWRDEHYGAADLDPVTRNPAYGIVNLTAGFGPSNGRWQFALLGKNLTDEGYFIIADDIPLFPLNYGRDQARPRSLALRFHWQFF